MSTSQPKKLHAAIIMDGNGRWATQRGLPRVAGHRAGAAALRRAVEAAPCCGIGTLTVYAFSSDNWRRPPEEVSALMRLFHNYLRKEQERCVREGVRLSVIGRRDRLPRILLPAIEEAEAVTSRGSTLHLRVAVDYSARDEILRAARQPGATRTRDTFSAALGACDVDLVIRTANEQRLSDFLLWECAYAEFVFSPRLWPDFSLEDLSAAVEEFHGRERKFGALPTAASA
jgi:undecaprenyl diphosphate synthase